MMKKFHNVSSVSFEGDELLLTVDGKSYRVDIKDNSRRLLAASQDKKENFVISPSGYGIRWPTIDEDLSVNALIGKKNAILTHHSEESPE